MAAANAVYAAGAARSLAATGGGSVEPSWLHTAGQIAGVALMIELLLALLIFAAVMFGLAYGAWWVSRNVIPVIGQYSAQAQEYIAIAEQGSERVAHGVASFHGARMGITAGIKAFFLPGHRPQRQAPTTRPLTPSRPISATTPATAVRAPAAPATAASQASPRTAQPARAPVAPATAAPTFRASGRAAGRAAGRPPTS